MKVAASLMSLLSVITFSMCLNAQDCPVTGLSKKGNPPALKNQELNMKKNRSTVPVKTNIDHTISITKMLNSGDDPNAFNENEGAIITGYMFKAKKENGESCNCYSTDDANHDIHVFIAPDRSVSDIGGCVVVEVTPWGKLNHPEWTVEYLNSIKGHKVAITGWLMYDFEHTNASAASNASDPKRGTVWEIHPITHIEDLDAGSGE